MAEIIPFADGRSALARRRRLLSPKPYCGCCFDHDGTINDLVAFKRYGSSNGMYCAECGEEFAL